MISLPQQAISQTSKPETVRDRLWVFSFATNSDFVHVGRRSVMSAAEGNFYLGVPNILMVQSSAKEAPYGRFEPPFEQYTVALRPLKNVVWSLVGSGGFHKAEETAEVLAMAKRVPNFRGVMLDDFFTGKAEGARAQWTVEELADVRRKLDQTGKKLDIFATFYVKHFELPLKDYLDLIDVLTLWNMASDGIRNVEDNLQKVERLYPHKRKMLGCYLVDYPEKQGVPVDLMKHQCEVGLRWLQQGRIEGIIFMGNTTMDLGFESVEWTRRWIQEVGDTKLK
ncbi:MAG: hypothetical protein WC740_19735 [Verrucomicrobiia bacterium]